ncbi:MULTISPECIES: adenosylcobinamide-GDP ribazoletransferase [Psychrobacter]|uniref:adenosylcobinamide-GDP ribazoletransferase n=1 Tax=Psychrobacter TaxID=497 RepID=UPI000EC0D9A5|nr:MULTISPECIES: adenosylcobinamide-GDP ribazoletransferase [Psychrobacter]MBE8608495.1 adenosylcobinamide-GDP ribazoletransferase [Pseudomonas lundensis]MCG3808569.1 adenosylcobinamide-GDP ribazoletransferase [Psychrobacter sp. Ps4]MCG3873073.1 adenosylcobinamide-GDP ribazoletransferase [Psychrobacter sp. Ps7]HCI75334.1 adenosylcobinamide-GDP ribazoletransferase [Psychrobacter sp.]
MSQSSNQPSSPRRTLAQLIKHEWILLLVAVQFLTRLSVPPFKHYDPQWLHQSSRHFPAVGLLVGLLCAGVFWLGSLLFTPLVAAVLSTAFGIKLTGAFHEDGLADSCDGLGGGLTRERTLTIMKDSRLGTYGVLGLVSALLLKISLLASMPISMAVIALILGHTASRLLCISLLSLLPYGGEIEHAKAKPMAQQLTPIQGLYSSGWLILAIILVALIFPNTMQQIGLAQWLLAMILALIATDYMRRLLRRRLDGYTGDGLGATQQLSEIAIYIGLAASIPFI